MAAVKRKPKKGVKRAPKKKSAGKRAAKAAPRAKKRGKRPAPRAKKAPPKADADYGRRSDYGASVDAFVAKLPPKKKEIVNALRGLVREAVPGVVETIRWGMPVFTRKKLICYASTKTDYVRFGFYARIELEDPENRVSGSLAYVKLNDVNEIERPILQSWIQQIVEHTGA